MPDRASIASFGLALVVVFALARPAGGGERAYLAAIEDLPLMPGLVEAEDAGTRFDSAYGRIVEAYAEGAATAEQVTAFYAQALPPLGWTRRSDLVYEREAEELRLDLIESGRRLTVHFTLKPGR